MVVATAAPVTPSSGKGPNPKIKQGSRMIFSRFAIVSDRNATVASPAPRKAALSRNKYTKK